MVRARSAQLHRLGEGRRIRSELHAAVRWHICSPSHDDVGGGLELKVRPADDLSRAYTRGGGHKTAPGQNRWKLAGEKSFHRVQALYTRRVRRQRPRWHSECRQSSERKSFEKSSMRSELDHLL